MANRAPERTGPWRGAWLAPLLAAAALIAVALSVSSAMRPGALIAALALGVGATVVAASHAIADRNRRAAAARAEAGTGAELADATERSRLFERIIDAIEEGVLFVDRDAGLRVANTAARRIFGLGSRDSSPALQAIGLPALVRRALATGGVASDEHEVYLPRRRMLALRAIPFEDGALVLVSDVTAARRLENVRKDFAANVSHELKTPVSSIGLLAEQLSDAIREDPETAARFASQLRVEAERLGSLVRDLLDLSRIESDTPLDVGEADALALAAETVERVRSLAEPKRIAVRVAGKPVRFRADASQVATAITNLLDNAVRYSPAGSEVRLEVAAGEGQVRFVVADDGPGIPSSEIGRIFERFYRVDKARARATGGTGLGLAIVKHVADRHGGTVEAASELGHGSTFTLRLPLDPEETS